MHLHIYKFNNSTTNDILTIKLEIVFDSLFKTGILKNKLKI